MSPLRSVSLSVVSATFILAGCAALPAVLVVASLCAQSPRDVAPGISLLGNSRQLLLVVTDGWDAANGTLRRFERAGPAGSWTPAGPPAPVVVGRNGLAWGLGLHPSQPAGPVKREGDGRSPAGVFRLGTAFGQSRDEPVGLRLPYLFLDDNVECVDDARSVHYNELITRQRAGGPDWATSDKMWAEPLYERGVVVEHNAGAPRPGGGSCIFLHKWNGPGRSTSGCTAMAASDLTDTLTWLDAAKRPLLVQLPAAEYARLRSQWALPAPAPGARDELTLHLKTRGR